MTTPLSIYYEGGTIDRYWIAPANLTLASAKRERLSSLYKSRWGAMNKLAELERDDDAKSE